MTLVDKPRAPIHVAPYDEHRHAWDMRTIRAALLSIDGLADALMSTTTERQFQVKSALLAKSIIRIVGITNNMLISRSHDEGLPLRDLTLVKATEATVKEGAV